MIDFQYDTTVLSTGFFTVTETDAYGAPDKDQTVIEIARRDGSTIVFERLSAREIQVSGTILCDTSANLRATMDGLKALLNLGSRPLRVTEDGVYREWTASLKNLNIQRKAGDVTRATFSMQFLCEMPFAKDGVSDTLVNGTMTTHTATFGFVVGGTYMGLPYITLTVTSITPSTSPISILISNPANSQELTITDTFLAGDSITIDTENKLIFHNSTPISGEGQFPTYIPGAGSMEFSDTASALTLGILANADRRWL